MKKNNMIKLTKKKETMKKYEVCGIKKNEIKSKNRFRNTSIINAKDDIDAIKKYVELHCKNQIEYKSYHKFLMRQI